MCHIDVVTSHIKSITSTNKLLTLLVCIYDNATGKQFNPVFPYGIYTIPEISVVGRSEQALTQAKVPYEIGKAKFEEIAKYVASNLPSQTPILLKTYD